MRYDEVSSTIWAVACFYGRGYFIFIYFFKQPEWMLNVWFYKHSWPKHLLSYCIIKPQMSGKPGKKKLVSVKGRSEIKQAGYWRYINKVTPLWYDIFNLQTHYFFQMWFSFMSQKDLPCVIIFKRKVTYLCNGEMALYAIKATGTFGKV